ncbi:MAG: GNAT family N-acetyltransferase [Anaerolineae bacterium]
MTTSVVGKEQLISMDIAASRSSFSSVPASNFSADELADIYNQTRIDYIVPMPMNARRMQAYVRHYDIDLDSSVVICGQNEEMVGLGMLGVRDDRAWITRLGIIPEKRQSGMGQCIMDGLLTAARKRFIRVVQLEVIEGNKPAHQLFLRNGFQEIRRLLVIRRPPAQFETAPLQSGVTTTPLSREEILACLAERGPGASWVSENASMVKLDELCGLRLKLPSGYTGWAVYEKSTFELTHVVCYAPASVRDEMTTALLKAIHAKQPLMDTKIENMPVNDPTWPVYQRYGYIEEFRRIEMYLSL